MVGKKRLLYSGNWQPEKMVDYVSKAIFPVQAKLEGFKGEDMGKREGTTCRTSRCPVVSVDMTLNRLADICGSV